MRLRTNRSFNNVSMSVTIVTTALQPGTEYTPLVRSVETNVDDVLKLFSRPSSQRRSTFFNIIQQNRTNVEATLIRSGEILEKIFGPVGNCCK